MEGVSVPYITPFLPDWTHSVVHLLLRSRSSSWLQKRSSAVRDMSTLISRLNLPFKVTSQINDLFFTQGHKYSMLDRLCAHFVAIMACNHFYSPNTIREKLRGKDFFPSQRKPAGISTFPLTSTVLEGYSKDYRSPGLIRLPLFADLEVVFYSPLTSFMRPTDLLPRSIVNFSRIQRIGLLRGGEGLFKSDTLDYLTRFVSVSALHINGIYVSDFLNESVTLLSLIETFLEKLQSGNIEYWGFNLTHSKTDQKGVGFRLDLTPGDSNCPICYDTLDMIRIRSQAGECLDADSPLFAFHTNVGNVSPIVMVLSYSHYLKMDRILSARFLDGQYCVRPHSRRAGGSSQYLGLGVELAKIKVLLRHSNGAIDRYLVMPPAEKVGIQNRLLKRSGFRKRRPSRAEIKELTRILVFFLFFPLPSSTSFLVLSKRICDKARAMKCAASDDEPVFCGTPFFISEACLFVCVVSYFLPGTKYDRPLSAFYPGFSTMRHAVSGVEECNFWFLFYHYPTWMEIQVMKSRWKR